MTKRAVIYVRQSVDRNGDALAVDRQEAACRDLAAARGWDVVRVIADNDTSATSGTRRGFGELMDLVEARRCDIAIVWAVDRLVRKLTDLERVIDAAERAGVKIATCSGDLDLSTPAGRLNGRILASVARNETETRTARQRLAFEQAARAGRRFLGAPRPFGYQADHVTPDPVEGPAVAAAVRALLGGSTISAICREWDARGLARPQAARPGKWSRVSVTTILRNPRIAGLNAYKGEITGPGQWTPLVPEESWRAVVALLADPARKPARGVRSLLGGVARCPCGNVITASQNALNQPSYRCNPGTRTRADIAHVATLRAPVDDFIERVAVERLSRPDAADLLEPRSGIDVAALREQAAAIRANLDELAADRALGLVSRSQMIAATERANGRLAEIEALVADAGRESVLAPIVAAENAAKAWAGLDLARRRAVLRALAEIELRPVGRGARQFDPANVVITWREAAPSV